MRSCFGGPSGSTDISKTRVIYGQPGQPLAADNPWMSPVQWCGMACTCRAVADPCQSFTMESSTACEFKQPNGVAERGRRIGWEEKSNWVVNRGHSKRRGEEKSLC